MNKVYRLVIFDWEGTLGDTIGHVLCVVDKESKKLKFGDLDESLARENACLGLVTAIRKLYSHLSLYQQEVLLEAVQTSLAKDAMEVCLIPGSKEVLEAMRAKGLTLAVATNKGQQSLQRAIVASGLDGYFKTTRSAGQVPAKPCPQMLEEILSECGVTASEALMVGDSPTDIDMATQIGVDAVGIDFYHQQTESLVAAGALHVFDDYQKLAQFLQVYK